MVLHFVDINPAVAEALACAFEPHPEVRVTCANILSVASHCLVSPANSAGYMDGGIDAAYLRFFGPAIQSEVQSAIQRRPEGRLPVGAALTVATRHPRIPFFIVAPTMEVPEEVPASHAGRALRAVLRLADADSRLRPEIYCPGLGTGVGHVLPEATAASMVAAYEHWLQSKPPSRPVP